MNLSKILLVAYTLAVATVVAGALVARFVNVEARKSSRDLRTALREAVINCKKVAPSDGFTCKMVLPPETD